MNNVTKTASQAGMYLNRNMKDADKSLTKLESQIAFIEAKVEVTLKESDSTSQGD